MATKKLEYDFTNEEVNYLLQVLNRVQIVGVQAAQSLLTMTQKLQNPTNSAELEKEQLENLRAKYEKSDKKLEAVN